MRRPHTDTPFDIPPRCVLGSVLGGLDTLGTPSLDGMQVAEGTRGMAMGLGSLGTPLALDDLGTPALDGMSGAEGTWGMGMGLGSLGSLLGVDALGTPPLDGIPEGVPGPEEAQL